MKFFIGFLILLVGFGALALDNPRQKVSAVIEDCIIAKHPDWAVLDIKITFRQADKVFQELAALPEPVEIKVAEVYHDFNPVGNVIFPLEVSAGTETKRVFLRAGVEVFKPVVAATKQIKRGNTITEQDVASLSRDVAMLPPSYFAEVKQVVGKEARTSIPKNSTIFEWMIKDVPAIRRGENVSLVVQGPNLLVKTNGVLLEDGYLGQQVKVKSKDAKNPVAGRLVSTSEVEVKL